MATTASSSGLVYAAHTHRGRVREHNEDAAMVDPRRDVFQVADGLGGHAAGEVASEIAVLTIGRVLASARPLKPGTDAWGALLGRAVLDADRAIREDGRAYPAHRGMGTTIVVAAVAPRRWTIAWVGDSRAYRFREGEIEALTTDDASGRHTLTQALGTAGGALPHVRTVDDVRGGDLLLLCSDGLYGPVPAGEIAELLQPCAYCAGKVDRCTRDLIRRANERGGPDNITAIVVRMGGHTHCCAFCGHCWSHRDGGLGDKRAHRCPVCKELEWRKA